MYVAIFLGLALALSVFVKPRDARFYRMTAGAILGVAFFSIWPFIKYYTQIFVLDDTQAGISLLSLAVFSLLLCILPVTLRAGQKSGVIAMLIFLVSVFLSHMFDSTIKHQIAVLGGYYDTKDPLHELSENSQQTVHFESKQGAYSLNIPKTWDKRIQKSTHYPYFVYQIADKEIVQLRPKCFHYSDIGLPDIVLNNTHVIESELATTYEVQCYLWRKGFPACLIKQAVYKSHDTARWKWLAKNQATQQGIEVDIVFKKQSGNDIQNTLNYMLSTLRSTHNGNALSQCVSTVEWF